MPLDPQLCEAFRDLARHTEGIDVEVYRKYAKDPLQPIVGLGDADVRLGFFGRDPGRDEVRHGEPFIGAGGQMLRKALYRYLYGAEMPDFQASLELGRQFFWVNTVPYKPLGNKAWSMRVKRRFHGLMRRLLIENWHGHQLITLGREAFLWFAIDQPQDVRQQLEEFWRSDERFAAHFDVDLQAEDGARRRFSLYPLPHPSPLNRTWRERFPELLQARLEQLDIHPGSLRL